MTRSGPNGRPPSTVLALFALASVVSTPVAEAQVGDPFEQRYSPAELDVYPQNFDIAQTPDGLIYVANSEGVLEFDGARWRLIELPEGEFARSLELGPEGRLFVGSYNHFGYLERDDSGRSHFVELSGEFVTEEQRARMADVWDVVSTDQGIFFTTRHMLFLWRDGPVATWPSESGFGTFAEAGGRKLIRERELGLKELVDGELRFIPGTEVFADNRVNAMTTLPDGRVMIVPEDQIYTLNGDRLEPMPIQYAALPRPAHIYRVEVLADGSVAMGTTTGNVHVLSADGLSGRRYKVSDYLISGLMVGRDGALWAVTDEDIVRLSIPSPWSYFGSQHGFKGFVTDFEIYNDKQLIATNAGVYELLNANELDGSPGFQRLDWGDNEFWSLVRKPEGLLVAESYQILLATAEGISPVTETLYPRRMATSRFRDDLIYVAAETGFATLLRRDGQWQLAGDFTDLDIRGYYPVEETERELWVGSYGNALHRFRLSADYSRIESREAFDESHGLRLDITRGVVASWVADRPVFTTEEGAFEYNGEVFVAADHPAVAAYLQAGFEPGVEFSTRDSGEIWANSGRELFRGRVLDQRWDWKKVDLGPFDNTAVEAVVFDGDTTWIGAAAALVQFDASQAEPEQPPVSIMLRGMQVRQPDQSVEYVDYAAPASPVLSSARQTVSFEYSVPSYGQSGGVEYRTLLEGFDTEWSGWTRDARSDYAGLGPGWYLLRVQARTPSGAAAGEASVAFQISPPWFRTSLAYLGFVLAALVLFGLLTAALVRWRSSYLRRLNRQLSHEVAQRQDALRLRTEELELANKRLKDLSEQDGLTGVANRRRLEDYLKEMWERCRDRHTPLTVLMIDADHFKHYNDTNGHLAGDGVLRVLADTLKGRVRDSRHLLARYGGEEFAVVLPGFDLDAAVTYGEMMRGAVDEMDEAVQGITVSVGIGQIMPHHGDDLDLLMQRADEALYRAKDRGRNCVAA